jgi:hypothetical protein
MSIDRSFRCDLTITVRKYCLSPFQGTMGSSGSDLRPQEGLSLLQLAERF